MGPPSANQTATPSSTHPLEARLLAWRQTQDALKMETLRRAYGIAEPVRRGMELKIVRDGTFRPAVLGGNKGGNVHEDILVLGGRDTEVGWEDIFQGWFNACFSAAEMTMLIFLMQETNSGNRLPSMTRWRRDSGWNSDWVLGWFFLFCLIFP